MVFFFEVRGGLTVYMGADKHENEALIANGWPEDIWFHVDSLSSAHVYLRLPRGPLLKQFKETNSLEHMPEALEDCCQLVKANSIEGCKVTCDVCYTAWENLDKRSNMDTGTIGFRDIKQRTLVKHVEKNKAITNRIDKTKREEFPDLAMERAQRDFEFLQIKKAKAKAASKLKAEEAAARAAEKEARDYKHMMKEEAMKSNADVDATVDDSAAAAFEEDFM